MTLFPDDTWMSSIWEKHEIHSSWINLTGEKECGREEILMACRQGEWKGCGHLVSPWYMND